MIPVPQNEIELSGFTVFIGTFKANAHEFSFDTYSTDVTEFIVIGERYYQLESDIDITDADELEQGLCYSRVTYKLVEGK